MDTLTQTRATAAATPVRHPPEQIDDIEMLRGVAILFVIFQNAYGHLITWRIPAMDQLFSYANFWPGVDIFFAVSGFVIARSLLPTLAAAGPARRWRATVAFWLRRFWRLAPSAWLWLAIIFVAVVAFNSSGALGALPANVAATVAGVLDIANIRLAGTFGHSEYGASFVYWSLSLEVQFYLLLPLAAFVLGRRLAWGVGALALLQLFLPRADQPWLMVFRTDAILIGVLIALWSAHPSYRLFEPVGLARSRLARAAVLLLPLALMAALAASGLNTIFFRVGLIALLAALLVLIASYDHDYLAKKGPIKRLFMWVGSRSYGLYLIHIPAFLAAREICFRVWGGAPAGDTLRLAAIATVLLLGFSELNYRLVERPLRAQGARIAQRYMEAAA